MEATDTDSQYDTGGALRASPGGGGLEKTQRKVQEGFLSSKVTVLCGPSSGHLPPQAFLGLFSASGTARSVPHVPGTLLLRLFSLPWISSRTGKALRARNTSSARLALLPHGY